MPRAISILYSQSNLRKTEVILNLKSQNLNDSCRHKYRKKSFSMQGRLINTLRMIYKNSYTYKINQIMLFKCTKIRNTIPDFLTSV